MNSLKLSAEDRDSKLSPCLELLVPWQIPASLELPIADKANVAHVLDKLEHILNQPELRPESISSISKELNKARHLIDRMASTHAPLKHEDIDSYDEYFLTQHVSSDAPHLTLLHSLLETCLVFATLCESNSEIAEDQVEIQRQGFLEYIKVMRRMFALDAKL